MLGAMWRSAVLVFVGCYSPSVPTGAPCEGPADCPRDLVCAAASHTCERVDVDAGLDAAESGCWGQWLAGAPQLESPVIVKALSSAANEGNVSLADTDLTVFFSRPQPLFGGNEVYVSTRSSPTAAFSDPEPIDDLSTTASDGRLTLSADGTLGVVASERLGGAGGSDLWATSRAPGGRFTAPTQKRVEALATAVDEFDPELTPDGLTLYYSQATMGGQALMVAKRTGDKFAAPTVLAIAGAGLVHADPTVSPDGRVIVFASGSSSSDLDLFVATRSSPSAAFGVATRLPINSPQVDSDPELAQDGCTLLFSSNRQGSDARDIWATSLRP